jgi:hypothetical protein
MFTRFIIRLFQLVFSAEIVFFSYNKSVNSVFQPVYQHNRTGPIAWVFFSLGLSRARTFEGADVLKRGRNTYMDRKREHGRKTGGQA